MTTTTTIDETAPAANIPGTEGIEPDTGSAFSYKPKGIGELNYLQSLIQANSDQETDTDSSPTFAGLTLSDLTASMLVGTDALKALQSVVPGVSLSLSGTSFNTIQNIRTTDSPTFAGLTLTSFSGFVKATAGVLSAAALTDSDIPDTITLTNITQITNRSHTSLSDIGTLTHATIDSYLDQSVKQAASPTFAGLNVTAADGATAVISVRGGNSVVTAIGEIHSAIELEQHDGSVTGYVGGKIAAVSEISNGAYAGMAFYTARQGRTPELQEAVRITNLGEVNIIYDSGLGIIDTNASHYLRLDCGSDLSADRILSFVTGDAARTITLNGSTTLADWFDQSVKTTASPTFVQVGAGGAPVTNGLTVVNNNDSATLTDFTQAITNAGILISSEYTPGATYYLPGLFWQTSNNSPTKPKAGIFAAVNGTAGTYLYFGTSNYWANGITHYGLVIEPDGLVDIAIDAGLGLLESGGTHYLRLKNDSGLTAQKTLTLNVGNADRTLTLSGNPTLADWFDQSVKTTASPSFRTLYQTQYDGGAAFGGYLQRTQYFTISASTTKYITVNQDAAGGILGNVEIIIGGYISGGVGYCHVHFGFAGYGNNTYMKTQLYSHRTGGSFTLGSLVMASSGLSPIASIAITNAHASLGAVLLCTVRTSNYGLPTGATASVYLTSESSGVTGTSYDGYITDHIRESTAAHGVEIDGVTLKDGGSTILTGGTNTFNITNGTASLDVAAGAAVNIDYDITVNGDCTLNNWFDQSVKTTASPTFAGSYLAGSSAGNAIGVVGSNYYPRLLLVDQRDTGTELGIVGQTVTDVAAAGNVIIMARKRTTSPYTVQNGDVLGQLLYYGYDGATLRAAAGIYGISDGTPGAADMPGRLVFYTTADGSSALTEHMRITSAGSVGIGTTSPGAKLQVNGTFFMEGSTAGGFLLRFNDTKVGATAQWELYPQINGDRTFGLYERVSGNMPLYFTSAMTAYFGGPVNVAGGISVDGGISITTGNVVSYTNKNSNLGGSSNRFGTAYYVSATTGTSRLTASTRECPICKTQMVRGTGTISIAGEEADYALCFCKTCGIAGVEEHKHLETTIKEMSVKPPKVDFLGMRIIQLSGNSRMIYVDFSYGPGVIDKEGRVSDKKNSTVLGEQEYHDFLLMDDKQQLDFLIGVGEREWYAMEETRLLEQEIIVDQEDIDLKILKWKGKDLIVEKRQIKEKTL